MFHPDRATYLDLARKAPYIPVWTEILADTETPISLYLKFAGGPDSFLLESVEGGENLGRYSLIGFDPLLTFTARSGKAYLSTNNATARLLEEKPFKALNNLMASLSLPPGEGPRFQGGLVGYLGYDMVRELEALPPGPGNDLQIPDTHLTLHRCYLVYDHILRTVRITCLGRGGENALAGYEEAVAGVKGILEKLGRSSGGTGMGIRRQQGDWSRKGSPGRPA